MENKAINKRGQGVLSKFFIVVIVLSLAWMTLFMLYGSIIDDGAEGYGYLNITTDPRFDSINSKVSETFDDTYTDVKDMENDLIGSETGSGTGFDDMIKNSFKIVKKLFSSSFKIMFDSTQQIFTSLGLHPMWGAGLITVVLSVIFIAILAGFMRTANW